MYGWLRFIIEDISGKDFNTYLTEEIIEKHGLGEIYPSLNAVPQEKRARIPQSYARGQPDHPLVLKDFQAMVPSGGFFATTNALTLFFQKLAEGKILRDHKVDTNEATGMFVARNKVGVTWNGLGVFAYSFKSETVNGRETNPLFIPYSPLHDHGDFFGHTGWIGDVSRCHTGYNPETGLTISVVFIPSSGRDNIAPHDIIAIAFRTLFETTTPAANLGTATPEPKYPPNNYPTATQIVLPGPQLTRT
jgi:CubicO group peptidase (beta-lactamase class C family)